MGCCTVEGTTDKRPGRCHGLWSPELWGWGGQGSQTGSGKMLAAVVEAVGESVFSVGLRVLPHSPNEVLAEAAEEDCGQILQRKDKETYR